MVAHGLRQRIKYARLLQRKASSPRGAGADAWGFRYCVQLALEGVPLRKKKHAVGNDIIGADRVHRRLPLSREKARRVLRSSARNWRLAPR